MLINDELFEKLSKIKFKPGGVDGSNWLISKSGIDKNKNILEISCNTGLNAIKLAQKNGSNIYGIDMNRELIERANKNINKYGLSDLICTKTADYREIPFDDESFDIVFCESVLIYFVNLDKEKILKECFRILKPGGILLVHDLVVEKLDELQLNKMRAITNLYLYPIDRKRWIEIFKKAGFFRIEQKLGNLILFNKADLLTDEAFKSLMRIVKKEISPRSIKRFMDIRDYFDIDKRSFKYILTAATKK
ncbi:MAG: methyltransferase domain-containing protein [Tissierellia bacterium]|nr:methyltransferase domain-containing protein [Tissierellia bacterium]